MNIFHRNFMRKGHDKIAKLILKTNTLEMDKYEKLVVGFLARNGNFV